MVDLIKELDKLAKKLQSGKPLQPYEVEKYNLYVAMQTMINFQARTEEEFMELPKEDLARTFYMLGNMFFGQEQWQNMPIMELVQEEEDSEAVGEELT